MKRFLAPFLICPACLPKELPLKLSIDREEDGDVVTGTLACPGCRKRFPIRDGIALLIQNPDAATSGGQWRYEEAGTVNQYLWSQYSDLMGDPEASTAYAAWSSQLSSTPGAGLDAGCAVGRFTFELAATTDLAVGCDLSLAFVRTARNLARQRKIDFDIPLEGHLRQEFTLHLPEHIPTDRTEFIVADALRLPFAADLFSQAASLNLLDRVSYPLAHLFEMNRVCRRNDSQFLFSSPFSWTTSATPEERWLGGTTAGKYPGRGIEHVRQLLEGKDNILVPPWQVVAEGNVRWRLRSHANHFEEIRSWFLKAERRG